MQDYIVIYRIIGQKAYKITKSQGNKLLPLYFDGAVNYFHVMPKPEDTVNLEPFYKQIERINNKQK